jgi:hypothetical protein
MRRKIALDGPGIRGMSVEDIFKNFVLEPAAGLLDHQSHAPLGEEIAEILDKPVESRRFHPCFPGLSKGIRHLADDVDTDTSVLHNGISRFEASGQIDLLGHPPIVANNCDTSRRSLHDLPVRHPRSMVGGGKHELGA